MLTFGTRMLAGKQNVGKNKREMAATWLVARKRRGRKRAKLLGLESQQILLFVLMLNTEAPICINHQLTYCY